MPRTPIQTKTIPILPTLSAVMALGLVAPDSVTSQESELSSEERAAVEAVVADVMSEDVVPGLSLAIVNRGRIVYSGGFGTIALDGESPATPETMYRVASVTKPFTSVAVLQLAAAGRLSLDDPVRRHCLSYRARSADPTIRHLLAHQGGIRHTTDREDTSITGDESLAESVRRIAGEELEFEPRTDTQYTSWGYALLGCVIEEVSGQRYFDYIREQILDPAGMAATVQDRPGFAAAGFSPGYRERRGRAVPSEVVDTRFKVSASGLISTVVDLARFTIALNEGRLLDRRALNDLFEAQATRDGELTPYTLGWIVASDRSYGEAYYFTGSMEGTTALLYLIPERGYAIAILTNRERYVREIAPMIGAINATVLGG